MSADDWQAFAVANKQSIWGVPAADENPHALFYPMKYDSNGNVRPGWNCEQWVLSFTRGIRFSTRNCHTVTRPGNARH
jgi:hypothetical protein